MKFEKLKKERFLHDPNNGRERSKPAKFYASLKAKVMIERVCPSAQKRGLILLNIAIIKYNHLR